MKLPSHTFYGGIKCPTCSFSLFVFNVALFILVAASISHFLTAATKFHVVPPTKKLSPLFFFLSLWLFFSGFELAGLSPYFLFFSAFNSLSLHSKFVGMATNVSLTL